MTDVAQIPTHYQALLCSAGTATLSVIAADGSIQSTLVWPDFDGRFIKLNMLRDSAKERALRRSGAATVLMTDRRDEDRYVSVRTALHTIASEGALAHLDAITQRNMGLSHWYGAVQPDNPEEAARRVITYLRPLRVYST